MNNRMYGYKYVYLDDSSCSYTDENLWNSKEACVAFVTGVAKECADDHNSVIDTDIIFDNDFDDEDITLSVMREGDTFHVVVGKDLSRTVEYFELIEYVVQD